MCLTTTTATATATTTIHTNTSLLEANKPTANSGNILELHHCTLHPVQHWECGTILGLRNYASSVFMGNRVLFSIFISFPVGLGFLKKQGFLVVEMKNADLIVKQAENTCQGSFWLGDA